MSGMSRLLNKYHIVREIFEFSVTINDMVELFFFIFRKTALQCIGCFSGIRQGILGDFEQLIRSNNY